MSPVEQQEVRASRHRRVVAQGADYTIVQRGALPFAPGDGVVPPHRVHHVGALAPPGQQLAEDLGGVLQVRIHRDHAVAACFDEPRAERVLVPEVARE